MIEVAAYLIMSGESFSPSAAADEHGLTYAHQNEPGEIGVRGRYKNKPIPDGHARVVLTNGQANTIDNNDVWAPLAHTVEVCRRHGASDVSVHLDVKYTDQCNIELEPILVKLLGSLGLPLTITCYELATLDARGDRH